MRLIDKDALKAKAEQIIGIDGSSEAWRILAEIDNAEEIDVEPVRHGRWLDGYGFAGNHYDCFICDQCKKESMAKTKYCHNCGARMYEANDG